MLNASAQTQAGIENGNSEETSEGQNQTKTINSGSEDLRQSSTNAGSIPWLQQGTIPDTELPAGRPLSVTTEWERQGARPRQVQHSLVAQVQREPISAVSIGNGIATDVLSNHPRDESLQFVREVGGIEHTSTTRERRERGKKDALEGKRVTQQQLAMIEGNEDGITFAFLAKHSEDEALCALALKELKQGGGFHTQQMLDARPPLSSCENHSLSDKSEGPLADLPDYSIPIPVSAISENDDNVSVASQEQLEQSEQERGKYLFFEEKEKRRRSVLATVASLHEPDGIDWERHGARPKQTQRLEVERVHTQDEALHESIYQTDGVPFVNDFPPQRTSYIDCDIPLSSRAQPYFGSSQAASGRDPYERFGNPLVNGSDGYLGGSSHAEYFRENSGPWSSCSRDSSFSLFSNFLSRKTSTAANSSATTNIDGAAGSSAMNQSGDTATVCSEVLAEASCHGTCTSVLEPRVRDRESSTGLVLNDRDFGNDSSDNLLVALERRVAEACALVERVLQERGEREQFGREIERKEQLIREQRARERREREERELREAESWPQQQEAINARSQWLCEHYQRHCRVRFPCCTKFYPCHRCHNISKACENEEAKACHATHLKCSHCQHEQEIDEDSAKCRKCGGKMSAYFCSICKHFTSVDKNPYHCEKCGICRIHQDKSFHCEVCNVCLDKRLEGKHKCRPDSGHDECCICLEDAFSGCQILPCSHKVHRECAIAMIQNGIRTCPICRHPLYSQPRE